MKHFTEEAFCLALLSEDFQVALFFRFALPRLSTRPFWGHEAAKWVFKPHK